MFPTGMSLALVVLLVGCVEPHAHGRFKRHGIGSVWTAAAGREFTDPKQYVPAALMALSLPYLFTADDRMSENLVEDPVFSSGKESQGDAAAAGLIGLAAGISAWDLIEGDAARALEVYLESTLLTEGVVAGLKQVTHRRRPGAGQNTFGSFPSSHTSVAFTAATFFARRFHDKVDGLAGYLGFLAYLPATFVAINRVESEKHYPSDVAAGALLATLFTNFVYNAHYGDDKHESGIFSEPHVTVVPEVRTSWAGVGLHVRF